MRSENTRKPLVYIAGPYTNPDPVSNTRRAIEVGMKLYDSGLCAVVIPHLSLLSHLVEPRPIGCWYRFDLDLLDHCHGLYRLDGASTGADAEVEHATEVGIPVAFEMATYDKYLTNWLTRLNWAMDA